ncbi:hypothetical protein BC827DRAFT_37932 [Russula dissimulans]|nr:hypothetical protein BC827DRAFT_37932 [Russula dissimulans]
MSFKSLHVSLLFVPSYSLSPLIYQLPSQKERDMGCNTKATHFLVPTRRPLVCSSDTTNLLRIQPHASLFLQEARYTLVFCATIYRRSLQRWNLLMIPHTITISCAT